jgi:methionyl-tRNA formyltransferase
MEGCAVAVVITQPDKLGSRGRPAPRPIADVAQEAGIPLVQPRRIREPEAIEAVLAHDIDAFVLASFGQIIPVALLETPRLGSFNVHPSLLPRWRGATPVVSALLAGDAITGVCVMRMEAGLDTGPVYARAERALDGTETASQLTVELFEAGAKLLQQVLADAEAGRAEPVPQASEGVTHAPRLSKADGAVDWQKHDAVTVDRMVRALNPWPGVSARFRDHDVKLKTGWVMDSAGAGEPGDLVRADDGSGSGIQTARGVYGVSTIQVPGRKPMGMTEFLAGLRAL